ncbi:hypothetical protein EV361DRAFT_263428 [Lentinula raphanica]|nr:hypothetical protein F5880DRAFT_1585692 [Lentinula raphanica]KAJ3970769.1 hypothetical protein EV361DRAFT_263428 [Lentinula raphanica]
MIHKELQRRLCMALPSTTTAQFRFDEIKKSLRTSTIPGKRQNAIVSIGRKLLDSMVKAEFSSLAMRLIDAAADTAVSFCQTVLAIIRSPEYHRDMFGFGDDDFLKFIVTGDLIDLYIGCHFCPGLGVSAEAASFIQSTCFVPLKQALYDFVSSKQHDAPVQVPSKRVLAQVNGSHQEFPPSKKRTVADKENIPPVPFRRSPKRKSAITNTRKKHAITVSNSHTLVSTDASAHIDLQDIDMGSDESAHDPTTILDAKTAAGSTLLMDMTAFINEDPVSTSFEPKREPSVISPSPSCSVVDDNPFEFSSAHLSQAPDCELPGSPQDSIIYQDDGHRNQPTSPQPTLYKDVSAADINGPSNGLTMTKSSLYHQPRRPSAISHSSSSRVESGDLNVFLPTQTLLRSQGFSAHTVKKHEEQPRRITKRTSSVFLPSDPYLAAQGLPLPFRSAPFVPAMRSSSSSSRVEGECDSKHKLAPHNEDFISINIRVQFESIKTWIFRALVCFFTFSILSILSAFLEVESRPLLFFLILAVVPSCYSVLFSTEQPSSVSLLKHCLMAAVFTICAVIGSLLVLASLIYSLTPKDPVTIPTKTQLDKY